MMTITALVKDQITADKPALFGNLIAAQLREIDEELLDEVMLNIFKVTADAKKKKQNKKICNK